MFESIKDQGEEFHLFLRIEIEEFRKEDRFLLIFIYRLEI